MRFTLAITFDETTPESVAEGSNSSWGYVDEAHEFDSLRDLVQFIRHGGFSEPSSSPVTRDNLPRWLSTEHAVQDYSTATERSEALHFGDMPPRNVWRVLKLAGLAK